MKYYEAAPFGIMFKNKKIKLLDSLEQKNVMDGEHNSDDIVHQKQQFKKIQITEKIS